MEDEPESARVELHDEIGPITETLSARVMHYMGVTWLEIAEQELAHARAARSASAPDLALTAEFYAVLKAILTAAAAVESDFLVSGIAGLRHPSSTPTRSPKPTKGHAIGYSLEQVSDFTPEQSADLGWLFYLRNESVHPTQTWGEPVRHPHWETNVGARLAQYSLEEAEAGVVIARAAVAAMNLSR